MISFKESLNDMIPILEDAHKKRPIEPRMEKLENLIDIVNSPDFTYKYILKNILIIY